MHPEIIARRLDAQRSDVDAGDVILTTTLGKVGSSFERMSAGKISGVDQTSGIDRRKTLGALGSTAPMSPSSTEIRTIIARYLGKIGPMLWELQVKLKAGSGRLACDATSSRSDGPP